METEERRATEKKGIIIKKEAEEDDDDVGPPPGFQIQCITSQTEEKMVKGEEKDADINENNDEEIEGPPPGWSSIPPATLHPSDVEMSDKKEETEDEEGPPPGWHSVPQASKLAEAVPTGTEMESCEDGTKGTDKGFQPRQKSVPQTELLQPTPPPPPTTVSSPMEKGQMVCGSCRRLLAYPRGAKYVQCSCCQTVNLVLEDHQVGQVKCGGCAVLLMYPYGAPSVRCCSCRFVTEIGAHNRRPPLSVQQARRLPSVNRVH